MLDENLMGETNSHELGILVTFQGRGFFLACAMYCEGYT